MSARARLVPAHLSLQPSPLLRRLARAACAPLPLPFITTQQGCPHPHRWASQSPPSPTHPAPSWTGASAPLTTQRGGAHARPPACKSSKTRLPRRTAHTRHSPAAACARAIHSHAPTAFTPRRSRRACCKIPLAAVGWRVPVRGLGASEARPSPGARRRRRTRGCPPGPPDSLPGPAHAIRPHRHPKPAAARLPPAHPLRPPWLTSGGLPHAQQHGRGPVTQRRSRPGRRHRRWRRRVSRTRGPKF